MGARPSKASAPAATPSPPPEASSCSSLWSELPPELAGLAKKSQRSCDAAATGSQLVVVLRRLPSLADRVRFGSVCRHWRHAARQQAPVLPPALAWTITSSTGKAQTIPDGEVHRLCPGKLAQCACSSESWLLMIGKASRHDTTESLNFLKNPLSGAIVLLPDPGSLLRHGAGLYSVTKFIVCRGDLIVASTRDNIPSYQDPLIACSPGTSPSWSTSTQGAGADGSCYQDIAFHDGSIYAMAQQGDLYVHRVSEDHGLGVVLSSAKLVIKGAIAIACRSACEAFGQDSYCCSGAYGTPAACRPTAYSSIFKTACPRAYSYAYDDSTSTFTCNADDYNVAFCLPTSGIKESDAVFLGAQIDGVSARPLYTNGGQSTGEDSAPPAHGNGGAGAYLPPTYDNYRGSSGAYEPPVYNYGRGGAHVPPAMRASSASTRYIRPWLLLLLLLVCFS
ncbi:hypothetical protein ACQ4PT_023408 [Festuca glaucescens]